MLSSSSCYYSRIQCYFCISIYSFLLCAHHEISGVPFSATEVLVVTDRFKLELAVVEQRDKEIDINVA